MDSKVIIIDFGSQYTQLIARRVRELNVYSEIVPFHNIPVLDNTIKGIILSGSPFSVEDPDAPGIELNRFMGKIPVLGICYGAQYIAKHTGGKVSPSSKREYGRASLTSLDVSHPLFKDVSPGSQVWMSHGDSILELSPEIKVIGSTEDVDVAAFEYGLNGSPKTVCIQFHPEVTHSEYGKQVLQNFIMDICGCSGDWTPKSFVSDTIEKLKTQLGNDKVVMGLSGGVDSTVAAELIHRAIGEKLYCIFVDNGLLRKDEFTSVLESYKQMGLNVTGVDASQSFYRALSGKEDPEDKRKAIGKTFIDVFDQEAHKITEVDWLGQGTIYPDVIESISVHGPSVTIKSHHNVGGLPEQLRLKVVEPLRTLFKDEVRKVGRELEIPLEILNRHPFPGPGLGIRILGAVTEDRVKILQQADDIFINGLKDEGLYDDVWQAATILLPVQTVGVMGDERTYENVAALRAVTSLDGMTADWCHLPYNFLARISTRIINQVKGINRVVYDISTKPPATIEWE